MVTPLVGLRRATWEAVWALLMASGQQAMRASSDISLSPADSSRHRAPPVDFQTDKFSEL